MLGNTSEATGALTRLLAANALVTATDALLHTSGKGTKPASTKAMWMATFPAQRNADGTLDDIAVSDWWERGTDHGSTGK